MGVFKTEGVRTAGNGSGQAGALAGLEHNHRDNRQPAQDLDNGEKLTSMIKCSISLFDTAA